MNTDAELLRCYVEEKSEPAFTELVQRHIGLVYSVALRRVGGDAHLAEDVTQTVFNDLARKAAHLLDHAALGGWLYLSANHASAALVRRERRRKVREHAAHVMQDTLSASEPTPDWEQLRPVIDDVIVALKDDDRAAIALRFFERRSFAEIGTALRLTDDAARKRVDRALGKLRAALGRRGVTSTTAALGVVLAAVASTSTPSGLGAKVAGHALAKAAAGSGAGVGAWLGVGLPAAGAIALGGLVIAQRQANDALRDELGRFAADRAALASVRAENDDLARRLAGIEALRTAAASALSTPAVQTAIKSPPVRPVAATIAVSEQGTIAWNGDFVSLGEFINRLRQTKAASDPESRVHVRADGSSYSAVTYVITEARKAGIEHLTVEGSGRQEGNFSWWWF